MAGIVTVSARSFFLDSVGYMLTNPGSGQRSMTFTYDGGSAGGEHSTLSLFGRVLVRTLVGILLVAVVLFLAAGTLDWLGGWLFVIALLACQIANAAILSRSNPDVLASRTTERPPAGHWDSRLFLVLGALAFVVLVLAGVDRRLGWMDSLPAWSRFLGLVGVLAGDALFVWAVSVNPFFSRFVRVQVERGQEVISHGPYRWVRHPGYLGWLSIWLGLVVLSGSVVALLVAWLAIPIVALRAVLEEKLLSSELEGYKRYARRVRSRLIPGAW